MTMRHPFITERTRRNPSPEAGTITTFTNCATDTLTHVELTWRAKRIEHRIRFGHPVASSRLDRHRRCVSFAPGTIFAVMRWVANDFGTVVSRIDILRAAQAEESFTTVPDVRPGGVILLSISGWPKVERVLQAIDGVEALGIDPADTAPEHWHHIHNRLDVGDTPRAYTMTRHKAWLQRRRVAP
jgi:Protein of unknown function (DUF2840)